MNELTNLPEVNVLVAMNSQPIRGMPGHEKRTIISAANVQRYADSFTELWMTVWFEDFDTALPYMATPFDREPHTRELWFRAMKGEYGEMEIIGETMPLPRLPPTRRAILEVEIIEQQPLLLEYHG